MEKVWLKNYPEGVPATINADAHDSIVDAFGHYAKKYRKKSAFRSFGVKLTYGQLAKKSRHFAAYLQKELGLKKSERVAIMLPNILQFPVALMGILRAGLVVVNVNPLYKAPELVHQLKDAEVSAVIVLDLFTPELSKALSEIPIKHVIVTHMGDHFGWFRARLINSAARLKKPFLNHISHAVAYKKALRRGKLLRLERMALSGEDVAFLQYTGGTTGLSKGAVLTHRNIVANVMQCLSWMRSDLAVGQEVVLGALPLYHTFSLTVCCFCFMSIGSECLLIANPHDVKRFIKTLSKYPISIFVGLNTLFNLLLHQSDFEDMDFSKLKLSIAGGMAMQESVVNAWKKATGSLVIEGYGLTEASPVVSINPLDLKHFNGSIGFPLPATDVEIRNDQGEALPVGKEGELWVHGPQVMQGYWRNPAETAGVLDDQGWLRTGDIARLDERGLIYLVDRKKDMILVSGFNVYPSEIEEVLSAHPEICEVAVVGVPFEKTGEVIKAFIVKEKGSELSQGDVTRYCRERLTGYKLPRRIVFCDELPKSSVGKVLRRKLREL